MTVRNPPVWMQSGTYNALDDRMVTGLLADRTLTATGTTVGLQGGVIPGFDQLKVTASGSSMDVTVAAGAVLIPSASVNPPGAYICYNDGPAVITHDIEATGNPRIDVIYAEVLDTTAGDGADAWSLSIRKGSPSASPTTPILVDGQFPIAAVRVVPASANGGVNKITSTQITDLRLFVASQGGTHLTKNDIPNPAHTPGRMLYNVDSGALYVSTGTTWEYYLTYQGWMNVFAALRPKHRQGVNVWRQNTTGVSGVWTGTPRNSGATTTAAAVQLTGMRSPSGKFKVSLSALGRMTAAGTAYMGVRVMQGTTTIVAPTSDYRSIGFSAVTWAKYSETYLIDSGLSANTDYTFQLEFYRNGATTVAAYFNNPYIMVEPLL